MLKKTTTRFEVIIGSTAEDFKTKLNNAFEELSSKGIKYTYDVSVATGFTAYIFYEVTSNIPETIREQFEMGQEKHTCIECPFFERPTDGRRRYTRCPIEGYITRADNSCCESFYEKLFSGEIELVEPYREVPRGL